MRWRAFFLYAFIVIFALLHAVLHRAPFLFVAAAAFVLAVVTIAVVGLALIPFADRARVAPAVQAPAPAVSSVSSQLPRIVAGHMRTCGRDGDECTICLDAIPRGHECALLPCVTGHGFHLQCFERHVQSSARVQDGVVTFRCPTCRQVYADVGLELH